MIFKIEKEKINDYLDRWSESYDIYLPSKEGELVSYETGNEIGWHRVPVWGGIKEFVYPGRNQVVGDDRELKKPVMIVGARGCDLKSLVKVFDKIFLEEEPVDTVYKKLRDNLTIVSVDCLKPAETCFCASVGAAPYAQEGFDLNISFVKDDIILETGSEKGEKLLKNINPEKASDGDIKKRDDIRDTSIRAVKVNFKKDYKEDNFRENVEDEKDGKYWAEKAEDCMLCGGCNFACPTCYCNLLDEISDRKGIKKVLQWDACQFKGYARVGGGDNPRPKLPARFRHRHLCKFRIMDEEFGIPGCTGCGRCISVCPAEIDIRDTVKGLL